MSLWRFYITHSFRDMLRNKQRTIFALFCVAVGVGAIVALGMLGVMIGDALTSNVAGLNGGDIRVETAWRSDALEETEDGRNAFPVRMEERLQDWADENGHVLSFAIRDADMMLAPVADDGEIGRPANVKPYFIDADVYPFYSEVTMIEPEGLPLSEALSGPYDVILSENLAVQRGLEVGDQIRLSRVEEFFTVSGIFPTETENFVRVGPETILFGYLFLDMSQAELFGIAPQSDEVYMQLAEGTDPELAGSQLAARFSSINITTRTEWLEQNQVFADIVSEFILIMGLAALVVGGVGIINTMLVIVGRRTVEIAVLKTLGLKGRQITLLFMTEAVLLGIFGSILGIFLGLLLSLIAQQFGELFLQQTLSWRITPEPMLLGLGMGIVVTTVFGFLPTLTAGKVRPATVLRPQDSLIPRAGIRNRLLAFLVLALAITLLVTQIVGDVRIGAIIAAIGLVLLALLTVIFWVFVWMLGLLPSFGWVDLKIALRAISTNRTRTATSLLSLSAGVFALSMIMFMSSLIVGMLNFSLKEQLGGNIMVTSFLPGTTNAVINALDEIPDAVYKRYAPYASTLISHNGVSVERLPTFMDSIDDDEHPFEGGQRNALGQVLAQDINDTTPANVTLLSGRLLEPSDNESLVIVLPATEQVVALGIQPGDMIELEINSFMFGGGAEIEFEVVGLIEDAPNAMNFTSAMGVPVPLNAISQEISTAMSLMMVDAHEEILNETLLAMSDVPGVMFFEISVLASAIDKFIEQMSAIPVLVAGLALFAGATIIANTVSLATLERRRQIGVMKAVGMKGRRVLFLLLLENGLVGLLGGVAGVGVSVLSVWAVTQFNGAADLLLQTVTIWQVIMMVGIAVGLALLSTLFSAWGASREKPMTVLRYE